MESPAIIEAVLLEAILIESILLEAVLSNKRSEEISIVVILLKTAVLQ